MLTEAAIYNDVAAVGGGVEEGEEVSRHDALTEYSVLHGVAEIVVVGREGREGGHGAGAA